jgi:iron(II)-dependent oxidoreductase
MATFRAAPELHPVLLSRLENARARTDALFEMLPPGSLYDRPVAERHRLIFYLGHLEAFDWNLLSPALGLESHAPASDKLFAFGIDPVDGGLPTDMPGDWPDIVQVEKYRRNTRDRLDEGLHGHRALKSNNKALVDGTLLQVAIEHRLMHAETLAYLLHNLAVERKTPQSGAFPDPRPAPDPRRVQIPAGVATLGKPRSDETFGWDNEFDELRVEVPGFSIDVFPVTNSEYLKFIRAGGYEDPDYWKPEDWEWKRRGRIVHPHFWLQRSNSLPQHPDTQWEYRAMFGNIPLPLGWPVYVSHAEASAYARWTGKKLPTEAQWHRAAYGTMDGTERAYPWGEESPNHSHGNFDFQHWDATPVDEHPAGTSAFGVSDLVGNGWEWTSSPFEALPGFEPFSFYPGYSVNFFDGKHFVMKGGSPRTDASMVRRSFRNWFQPHYPHVYATFRCVED